MPVAEPPSGRQIELRSGLQRAVVVEVGGGLRELTVGDWHVLDGYKVDRMADGGRGQPLLPWPNRLADGRYTFHGEHLQLPVDEVDRHNAIHGLTRWLNWSVAETHPDRARLTLLLHPRPGYPFTLALELEYVLDQHGLTVQTTARNAGDRPLPFGAGQHPYFTVGTPSVDSAHLELAAARRVELDARHRVPTGRLLPNVGTELDFAAPRAIGGLTLDDCYTDLVRDANGCCRAALNDVRNERRVEIWADRHYRYLQVFSGDTLAPARRRQGLAIEPMTCPPNALQSAHDLMVLSPDESVSLTWGVRAAL